MPVNDVAASFQEAVCDVLVRKALDAAAADGIDHLLIGGGVAANSRLRQMAEERAAKVGVRVRVPRPGLCTDNGAMVAALGAEMVARVVRRRSWGSRPTAACRSPPSTPKLVEHSRSTFVVGDPVLSVVEQVAVRLLLVLVLGAAAASASGSAGASTRPAAPRAPAPRPPLLRPACPARRHHGRAPLLRRLGAPAPAALPAAPRPVVGEPVPIAPPRPSAPETAARDVLPIGRIGLDGRTA